MPGTCYNAWDRELAWVHRVSTFSGGKTRGRHVRVLPPLLLAATLACSAEQGPPRAIAPPPAGTGIAVVENDAPRWGEGQGWRLSVAPALSIGMRDGPAAYQLYRAYHSVMLRDGRIVVANAGTGELRFFDSEGRFLQSAGRIGDGPGEFRVLRYLFATAADSLLVWDAANRRISLFDLKGTFQRSYAPAPYADSPISVAVVAPLADGTMLIGGIRPHAAQPAVQHGLIRDTIDLVHIDAAGAVIAEVGRFPGAEWYATSDQRRVPAPFARRSHLEVSGNGFYFGDNAAYEISHRRADGSIERIIRKGHALIDVTPEMVDEQKRQWIAGIAPERQEAAARMWERVDGPPTMPAFSQLEVDADGNLWVKEYTAPARHSVEWSVFAADGSLLGTVDLPQRLTVHEIGSDYVMGCWLDEEDVEYVRLYELVKR